jgi:hypothetical protein
MVRRMREQNPTPLEALRALEAQDGLRERAHSPVSPAKSGSNVEEPIIIDPPSAIARWTVKAIEVVLYIVISTILAAIGFILLAHLIGHSYQPSATPCLNTSGISSRAIAPPALANCGAALETPRWPPPRLSPVICLMRSEQNVCLYAHVFLLLGDAERGA